MPPTVHARGGASQVAAQAYGATHSCLADSSASAKANAAVRGQPETCELHAEWRIRTPEWSQPTATSTVSTSPNDMSVEREPNSSRTASAFTDTALARRGCRIANMILANPVRLASNRMSAAIFDRCLDRPACGDVAGFTLNPGRDSNTQSLNLVLYHRRDRPGRLHQNRSSSANRPFAEPGPCPAIPAAAKGVRLPATGSCCRTFPAPSAVSCTDRAPVKGIADRDSAPSRDTAAPGYESWHRC